MSFREALIAWVDIQIFETKNEPIVEEIWSALSTGAASSLVPKDTMNEIKVIVDKGPPYPPNMFSKLKEEIFVAMRKEEYSSFVENCTLASIYSKRRWNSGISLPDETFERLFEECDTKKWKLKLINDSIKVYQKKISESNVCYMNDSIINAPLDMIVNLLFLKDNEYDKNIHSMNILEKINDETFICHLIASNPFYPIVKRRDMVYLTCLKKAKNGDTVLLLSGCDHKNAPETKDNVRVKLTLMGSILTPLSSSSTRHLGITQVMDSGNFTDLRGLTRKMTRDRALSRAKSLRDCAEKTFIQSQNVKK